MERPPPFDVHVAVFGHNEGGRLQACLQSIATALGHRHAMVTVILNGSRDGSEDTARAMAPGYGPKLAICTIPHADKSNAINRFFYDLSAPARLYLCVDAYATINPEAITAIEQRLAECPAAHVVTGIAANGRHEPLANERTVQQGGIIHGQLYALRPEFLRRIRAEGIRLPIGLYRGDGLIGYLACTNLDPVHNAWDNAGLAGVAGALFSIQQLSPWRLQDIHRHLRRTVRQMRGKLENAAIREIATTRGFRALPGNADDMIRDYLSRNARPRVRWQDRPFMRAALRQHRRATPPDPAQLEPNCS